MVRRPPFRTKALAARAGRSHGQNAPVQSGNRSRLSSAYIRMASPSCLILLAHLIFIALDFALARAGNSSAARIAMMAMTTSSSMSVKAAVQLRGEMSLFIMILGNLRLCRRTHGVRRFREWSDTRDQSLYDFPSP